MKKQALAAVIAATISMPTMADFLGVYAGLDYRTNQTSFSDDNSKEDDANIAGYIAFEHFIPLLPNAKVKFADLSSDKLDNDSSAMNGILYYELFDNGLFEFDLGVAYTSTESFNETADLAQAYGAAKVHIPGVAVQAFAEVIAGSVTDDNATDAEIGLAYNFNPDSLLLNFSVRAGYRFQEMEFKKFAEKQTNEGLFAGVEVHF